ncbi:MAG: Rieske 2Fe-2S domain-containing protein [Cyclobacteriaceae bacterium]|nr:Rieske 2Fe-2S domain-containing protein [Cyclobacteriaceae bacterium]
MQKVKLFHSLEEALSKVADGAVKRIVVGSKEYCLIRFRHDFFVTSPLCPHLGQLLFDGKVNPFGEIVCPLHGYRFHLGTGEESEKRCPNLKTSAVSSERSGIYVWLD